MSLLTYRQFMQKWLRPLAYIDYTDDFTQNLGSLGGQTTGTTTTLASPLIRNNLPTDSQSLARASGTYGSMYRDVNLGKSLQTSDFTISGWYGISSNRYTMQLQTPTSTVLRVNSRGGTGTSQAIHPTPTGGSELSMAVNGTVGTSGSHVVVRRMRVGNSTELSLWINGSRIGRWTSTTYNSLGPDEPAIFRTTLGNGGSGNYIYVAEYAAWGRALSDDEIMSMSVNYAPVPAARWMVLESGLEVPVGIEGEYTNGTVTPLSLEGIYREATPGTEAHALVTGADFYHEYGASREPVTTEYVRSNRDATSYSVWVKWDGTPTTAAGVITHQPGATFGSSNNNIYMQSNGIVTLGGGGDTTSVNISPHFTDGQWHHYALVAFVGRRYFYADGVQEAVGAIPTTATVLDTVRFGSMFSGTTEYPLNGLVSDCAVISAYLPPDSVTDIYNAGRGTAIPAHVEPI